MTTLVETPARNELGDREMLPKLLVAIAGVCNGIFAVALFALPPATEFEPTIYGAYPEPLWGVFLVGLTASILVLVRSASERDHYWRYGLALVFSLYVLFNLLPLFRGWALYGRNSADVLTHIGVAKSILETGSIPAGDWYPVIHVLLTEFEALGIPFRSVSPLLSAFFTPVYIASVYLLGQRLLGDKHAGLTVLVWSIPLLYSEFHHTLHPAMFSFLLVPLLLVVVIGAYDSSYYLPHMAFLTLFAVFLVLFHPVTSLYTILLLTVSIVARAGYSRLAGKDLSYSVERSLAVVMAVGWLVWYLRFEEISAYVMEVISVGDSPGGTVASEYGSSQVEGVQSVEQLVVGFITNYGPLFIVCSIAGLALAGVVARYVLDRQYSVVESWLSLQFLTGVAISVFGLFAYIVAFNPVRNSRYMILMATLFAGVFTYRAFEDRLLPVIESGTLVRATLVVLLISAVGISVMTSYQHNYHMTYAEEHGTDWYYQHRAADAVGVSMDVTYKMRSYSQGGRYEDARLREFGGETSPLDRHFGYTSNAAIGDSVDGFKTYVTTKPYDTEAPKQLHPSVRDKHVAYHEEDLDRLETDRTADRIYDNSGYTIWFVDPDD